MKDKKQASKKLMVLPLILGISSFCTFALYYYSANHAPYSYIDIIYVGPILSFIGVIVSIVTRRSRKLYPMLWTSGLIVSNQVSGYYYYKELQTLEGYVLDEDKHEFELTLENEPVTVFDINKENPALNKLVKTKVTLVKVDANDETKKLSGAEFELFTSEGESLGTYVTDEKGEINIPNLGYGKYYFKENKSPNGYQKLADKIEFSMDGKDITITCRNHIIPKTSVPKLGFEDSTLLYAVGFVCIGLSVLGISFYIYHKKKNSRKQ